MGRAIIRPLWICLNYTLLAFRVHAKGCSPFVFWWLWFQDSSHVFRIWLCTHMFALLVLGMLAPLLPLLLSAFWFRWWFLMVISRAMWPVMMLSLWMPQASNQGYWNIRGDKIKSRPSPNREHHRHSRSRIIQSRLAFPPIHLPCMESSCCCAAFIIRWLIIVGISSWPVMSYWNRVWGDLMMDLKWKDLVIKCHVSGYHITEFIGSILLVRLCFMPESLCNIQWSIAGISSRSLTMSWSYGLIGWTIGFDGKPKWKESHTQPGAANCTCSWCLCGMFNLVICR